MELLECSDLSAYVVLPTVIIIWLLITLILTQKRYTTTL